eukprot:TRINITY_DN67229_c0_g1_i1.p1 TRINITY_DN67229_c0_g1~~TRINITY_DN67229_c0_g1_i1.p1  ORF type:complete len:159 (-),score=19.85 TRINITY_DN67229_c0_g1_i1:62-538(-)
MEDATTQIQLGFTSFIKLLSELTETARQQSMHFDTLTNILLQPSVPTQTDAGCREDQTARQTGTDVRMVKLNVGGQVFATEEATLLKDEDSFFSRLLLGGWNGDLHSGEFFLDRDPALFARVLQMLRSPYPQEVIEGLNSGQWHSLSAEADLPHQWCG